MQLLCVDPSGGEVFASSWIVLGPLLTQRSIEEILLCFGLIFGRGGSITPLNHRFERLTSYVIDPLSSIREVMDCENWDSLFHLPLYEQAFQELQVVRSIVQNLDFDTATNDYWLWREDSKAYTPKKYYTFVHKPIISNLVLNWIWSSSCTMSIKVNHG